MYISMYTLVYNASKPRAILLFTIFIFVAGWTWPRTCG